MKFPISTFCSAHLALNPNSIQQLTYFRLTVEGDEARNIDEAISVLNISSGPALDKHPEKRMKAAYEDFENLRLPQLKSENPSMRLSQLKQMLRKEWQKHPDNPLNRAMAAAAAASRN